MGIMDRNIYGQQNDEWQRCVEPKQVFQSGFVWSSRPSVLQLPGPFHFFRIASVELRGDMMFKRMWHGFYDQRLLWGQ